MQTVYQNDLSARVCKLHIIMSYPSHPMNYPLPKPNIKSEGFEKVTALKFENRSCTQSGTSRPNSGLVHTYPESFGPAIFSFQIQKFSRPHEACQIEFACPYASDGIWIHSCTQGFSAIKCVQSMRHKTRDSNLVPRAHVSFAFKFWYSVISKPNFDFPSLSRAYWMLLWNASTSTSSNQGTHAPWNRKS